MSPDGKYACFLGVDGYMLLIDQKTRQLVSKLKINGGVKAAAFFPEGDRLICTGSLGEMYIWDIGTRRCIWRGVDEGCIHGTAAAVSPDGSFFALGSDSGVVNLYDAKAHEPKSPVKSVFNLTTAIHHLHFNADSQILAMGSRSKKDALKLLHVPSMQVFKNWPTPKTTLGYINSMAFSPSSGYISIGNDKGKAILYRVLHYKKS
jgi:U3 small nucleolar RNA-associated protein 18